MENKNKREVKLLEWDFTFFAPVNSWHLVIGDLRVTWSAEHEMAAYSKGKSGPVILHGWDEFEKFMNETLANKPTN